MKRFVTVALALVLVLGVSAPVFAATSQESAVKWLVLAGIYQGDENGNLNIDKGLTRAELAVILTRRDYSKAAIESGEIDKWYAAHLSQGKLSNTFTDVPGWAVPYVEYCYVNSLMNGVGGNRFDPNAQVNPKMVCTVILRRLKLPETDWNYDTSVNKAQSIELTKYTNVSVSSATITRGDTALILVNAINGHYIKTPSTTPTPTPTIPEPTTTPSAYNMTIDEMKAEIVRLTNEERKKAGLNPVEVLPELMDCAQLKAQDMFDNDYFDHKSKKYGTPDKMIKKLVSNVSYGTENLAHISTKYPRVFVESWMNSKTHKENILTARHLYIGIGIVPIGRLSAGYSTEFIVVQQFAG